ncbi:MFS transporter [Ktedonosporobacter rubrisoli]|nr:MFS transporter [Ktedonosporobacter rubrisoli]
MAQKPDSSDLYTDDLAASVHAEVPSRERRPDPPLWRNRDYMLLWSGQMISSIGTQVSQITLPLLVLALTFSPVQAGLVGALRGLPFAIFSLPAGALVDRWDRRKVMLLCDTGRALALGSIAVALWLGCLSLLQLCLVALIEGTLFTFFYPADVACLPRVVSREQLPAATAQNFASDSLSSLLGPFLGGMLYGIGHAVPFLCDAFSYVCSVIGLFFMRTKFQQERTQVSSPIWREVMEGLTWLWQNPLLRLLALLYCGLSTPIYGYALAWITLAQRLHATPFVIGALFACSGIGSIAGALLAPAVQKRLPFGRLIVCSAWIWAIGWLIYAYVPNLLIFGVIVSLAFINVSIFNATQFSYRLIVTPDHLQGRVNSIFRLIAFGGQPLGLLVTGWLIQWTGPNWAVIILFVPQGLVALMAALSPTLRGTPFLSQLGQKKIEDAHWE